MAFTKIVVLYEIKHSTEIVERQMRYLKDDDKCNMIEGKFGAIIGKYVLYRGENETVDDIHYWNVEQFLCEFVFCAKYHIYSLF